MSLPASNITGHLALGAAILERFASGTTPAIVKTPLATFKKSFGAYEAANLAVMTAEAARDGALSAVGPVDDVLDASLEELANHAIVTAKLAKRARPFAAFSTYSVSDLQRLPYATEPGEVDKLVAAIVKAKPDAAVLKAAKVASANGAKVRAALKATIAPQAAYTAALGARDKLLPDLVKALGTLKRFAAAAYADDPAQVKALFAPPGALVAPAAPAAKKAAKTRAKKKAAKAPAT